MHAPRIALLAAALALGACSSVLDLAPPPTPQDAAPPARWSFADDFDLGDLRLWTKTGRSANGTLEVVHGGAASGCCALHARLDAGGTGFQYAIIAWPEASPAAAPVTRGTIAVRARIKATALASDTRELSFAEGGTQPTAYASAGLGATGSAQGFAWGFILSNPTNAGFTRQSANLVADALGGWHCVELVLNVDAGAGHVSVFMDSQPVPQVQGNTNTTVNLGWDSVTLGLGYGGGSSPSDLLVDDAKVAIYDDLAPTIHLGCD